MRPYKPLRAMATNLDIIKRALKKIRVLASGRTPDGDMTQTCMDALSGLYLEAVDAGAFGRFSDVLATENYTAGEFQRIRASDGVTVTLPLTISDNTYVGNQYTWPAMTIWGGYDYGAWSADRPRPPFNNSAVQVIRPTGSTTYTYVAERGAWVSLDETDSTDTFPFQKSWEDGWAALLAERVADNYGKELGPGTQRQASWMRSMMTQNYDNPSQPVAVDYF